MVLGRSVNQHPFGQQHFDAVHKLDFLLDPTLPQLFEDSLEPQVILDNADIRLNVSIILETDLIFFDVGLFRLSTGHGMP